MSLVEPALRYAARALSTPAASHGGRGNQTARALLDSERAGEATMIDQGFTDSVSDTGIAVMCDIARASGLDINADKQAVLDRLVADGLVEILKSARPTEGTKFAVTRKGQRLLDDRGVGANES
jgi:hypothetical protein